MKKVLLLADCNSNHTRKWALLLRKNGNMVRIFSLYPIEDNWAKLNGIEIYHFFTRPYRKVSKISKLLYPFAVFRVNELLKTFAPEIVNAHYASSYGLIGALAKTKKFYVSFWGTDAFVFPKKSVLHRKLISLICKKSDLILSSSKTMSNEIKLYTQKSVETIPFGIDMNQFEPRHCDISATKKSFKIGILKSLEPIYRIDIAIEAIKTLNDTYPNKFELFICGAGSLENELKRLGDSHIHFLGKLNQEEVPSFLNSLDIFLNTTQFESFGVSTIEAMACGLPVIAHQSGGAEEIISHNMNGVLYQPNTSASIVKAIDELVKQPQKMMELGQNARKHIDTNYNLFEIQQQITAFF